MVDERQMEVENTIDGGLGDRETRGRVSLIRPRFPSSPLHL